MSWIACKGGSGATFLASNFAYALAASGSKRVALIDLNLQFWRCRVVSFRPAAADHPGGRDQADTPSRQRPAASSMIHVTPNCHVLAAPENLESLA